MIYQEHLSHVFAELHVDMHEHDIDAAATTRQLQDSNLKGPPRLLHNGRLVSAVGWIFETGFSTEKAGFRAKSSRPTAAAESVTFPRGPKLPDRASRPTVPSIVRCPTD